MRDLPLPTFPFAELSAPPVPCSPLRARLAQAWRWRWRWRWRLSLNAQRERANAINSTAPHSHTLSGGRTK